MAIEILKGLDGKSVDMEGIPFSEVLSQKEGRRCIFQRKIAQKQEEFARRVILVKPNIQTKPAA